MPSARCITEPPGRLGQVGAPAFALAVLAAAAAITVASGSEFSLGELARGLPRMGRILSEMVPPATTRLPQVAAALFETFQMAFLGTLAGAVLSIPLAALAARNTSPHPALRHLTRAVIAVFRTVPDLVWALLFVAAVGLGPFAGTLAIMVDKTGFCSRFFAEAMEEMDPGPQEALRSLGAGRTAVLACAIVPAVLPSWINTVLFGLEKAIRSSVVLGLVGAGGIGIELQVAMDLFRYDEAATAILAVLGMVLAVEQVSAALRRRLI